MKNKVLLPLLLIIGVALAGFWACYYEPPDYEPELPPISHEKKHTFGCKVNDKIWLPEVLGIDSWCQRLTHDLHNGKFIISAEICTPNRQESIRLWIYNFNKKPGVYQLNDKKPGLGDYYIWNPDNPWNTLYTDSIFTGSLNLTHFDTINWIIAGTFEFTVCSLAGDTFKITDGRFDL
jgi:hypothetical protein